MSTKAYYNDNLLLTPLPHDPTYGYWISPTAEFAGKTEQLEITGKAGLDFVNYYGGETRQFTNVLLPVQMRYRSEKDEWGFAGGFNRDNTLMGELQTTGLVLRFTQRNMWNANPTWTRNLTETLAFQGSAQFTDTSYENGLRLNLVNYQVWGGSASIDYHYSEQDKLQLSATYTNFHTTNSPSELRVGMPGALATLSHRFAESLDASIYGGPRFLFSSSLIADTKFTGNEVVWIYGTSLSKRFEQAILVRWEKNLHHFYDPPLEVLRGLGETYRTHPGFIESLGKIHPDLPEYMGEAVAVFVDALETAAIEGMIADDERGRLAE